MSLNNVPSKREMMRWNPQSLADYMRRLNLTGCDKAVVKGGISGAQFMKMTELDLQVFPGLYVPVISKIQSEIRKGDQRKAVGQKSKAQKFPQQAFVQEEEVWDSDEFENESDYDEEAQHQARGEDGYICALIEPQDEEASSDEYEVGEVTTKPTPQPRPAKLQDSKDRDPVPLPAERIVRPPIPCPPKVNNVPRRALRASAGQPILPIDRSKKPGKSGPSKNEPKISKGSTAEASSPSTSKVPKPRPPKLTDLYSRTSTPIPPPPLPPQPTPVNISIPDSEQKQCIQDLDPSWYGGQWTRHQAEVALREVNKDGAFIVRDSSKSSEDHPYTLMLLKQEKVFNIKIRNQGNSYSLGTRLNNKSFPGVKEMITHHTHNPLLLIDAADQSSEAQSLCCLLHPAGL
ncbi:lymphocyte cytosolic protein 2 isoform X1 [Labrus bergylta]|uniref:lymphocyte cytosolic protein 2 isoform X1 n=1 Tax=Labrus bergylta TaxID=56723 RepID=UPI00331411A4